MGVSIFTSDEYVTFNEFAAFITNAPRYITINACVWNSAQQGVLLQFFEQFRRYLENTNPVNPLIPWGSPGVGWAASSSIQAYFNRVRDAVPKGRRFIETYPYSLETLSITDSFPNDPDAIKAIAMFFEAVAIFWGAYLDKDSAETFLNESDYTSYVFGTIVITNPGPPVVFDVTNINFGAIRSFVSGMSRVHFAGKEITLPPNHLVLLQNPAFLLTGRLIQFPQDRSNQCCQISAADCMRRVNCGVYISKLVNDVTCDVACYDPCRRCDASLTQGCLSDGGFETTRTENEFNPEGKDAERAGDRGNGIDYADFFVTIRPFVNSDLLIPQIFNRLGKFGGFPWDLGLPDEFLTQQEINEREIIERENPAFDTEIAPGGRGRRMQFVPCICGSGLRVSRTLGNNGGTVGCSSCKGSSAASSSKGSSPLQKAKSKYFTDSNEKGPSRYNVAVDDVVIDQDVPDRSRCRRGKCTCEVNCFEKPKAAIPGNMVRYIRPRTVFGLLEYLVEKLDWFTERQVVRNAYDRLL